MRPKILLLAILIALAARPLIAADLLLVIGGTRYRTDVRSIPAKLCTLPAALLASPARLVGDGESFPVARVKKGEKLGDVRLIGDGESFPFEVALKGVTITDATVRSNGSWTMSIKWAACENIPKAKH